MKAFIFGVLILFACFASVAQTPPIYHEQATNKQGVVFARIVNTTPYSISCYIKDNYNFITFVVPGKKLSMWYPVYGYYEWYCE